MKLTGSMIDLKEKDGNIERENIEALGTTQIHNKNIGNAASFYRFKKAKK